MSLRLLLSFLAVSGLAGPVLAGNIVCQGNLHTGSSVAFEEACSEAGQLGNGATGAQATSRANDVFYFSSFTATSAGTVNFGHVKFAANSGTNKMGLYDSDGVLLSSGSVTGTSGTGERKDVTLVTPVCLTAGVAYYLGVVSNDTSYSLYFAALAGSTTRSIAMTHATGPAATLDVGSSTLGTTGNSYILTVNDISNDYE